jgi:hypothetical protein
MNAHEMVITARIADHYEREGSKGSYEPPTHAETLFKQFKRSAPKLLRFLLDSQRTDREIGDWIWEFYGRWSAVGPVALKYFAEDELARLEAPGPEKRKKTSAQLQREIDEALSSASPTQARRAHATRDSSALRVGQRFDHLGHTYEVLKIGRDKDRTVQIARPHTDRFGKAGFIDHRSFPARDFDRQHLRPLVD